MLLFNMNKNELLEHVRHFCQNNNIKFIVKDGKFIETSNSGVKCSGFFEETPDRVLGIAKDLDDQTFYEVLVHEFCHVHQCLENTNHWKNVRLSQEEINNIKVDDNNSYVETGDLIDLWISGYEVNEDYLAEIFERAVMVEADCEKRTIEFAVENDLDISIDEYGKKANAYIFVHYYALNNRKWNKPGSAPYTKKEFY